MEKLLPGRINKIVEIIDCTESIPSTEIQTTNNIPLVSEVSFYLPFLTFSFYFPHKKTKNNVFMHFYVCKNSFVLGLRFYVLEFFSFPCIRFCLPPVKQCDDNIVLQDLTFCEKNEPKQKLISAKPPIVKLFLFM